MDNAFQLLDISERLVISEDEIRTAFREAGKTVHPDAGGSTELARRVNGARDILIAELSRRAPRAS